MGTAATIETESKTEKFESLALSYMDSIYRSALYMAKNESDAQDLVQETYLRAYKFFDKFREGSNLRAWLYRILRNTFINNIRRNKIQSQVIHLSEIEAQGQDIPSNENTEDKVFGDLFDDDISTAINRLPEEYRTTVLLADVEKLSYKEIAEIMECPIGTVMSRLHRSRKFLKESLRDYAISHRYIQN